MTKDYYENKLKKDIERREELIKEKEAWIEVLTKARAEVESKTSLIKNIEADILNDKMIIGIFSLEEKKGEEK